MTITAATFLSCMLVPGGTVMPSCDSMLLSFGAVNGPRRMSRSCDHQVKID